VASSAERSEALRMLYAVRVCLTAQIEHREIPG